MATEEVAAGKLAAAEQAAAFWREIPQGNYTPDVKVIVEGDEVFVGDERDIANLMEYGSEHNEEYAARAQTEARFDGSDDADFSIENPDYDGDDYS